jgi:ribosomal protein S18 acetylase RimI-like enzyme
VWARNCGVGARDENVSVESRSHYEPVDLRPRLESDIAAVLALLLEVHRFDAYPLTWPADPKNWIAPARELNAWVAVQVGGLVVGHVALHSVKGHPVCALWSKGTGDDPEQLVALSRLIVSPVLRGRGIGEGLIRVAVRHSHAFGLRPVLDVATTNGRAIDLYRRLGWIQVGTLPAELGRKIAVAAFVGPPPPNSDREPLPSD